jgi:hypothetical protein
MGAQFADNRGSPRTTDQTGRPVPSPAARAYSTISKQTMGDMPLAVAGEKAVK